MLANFMKEYCLCCKKINGVKLLFVLDRVDVKGNKITPANVFECKCGGVFWRSQLCKTDSSIIKVRV